MRQTRRRVKCSRVLRGTGVTPGRPWREEPASPPVSSGSSQLMFEDLGPALGLLRRASPRVGPVCTWRCQLQCFTIISIWGGSFRHGAKSYSSQLRRIFAGAQNLE